MLLVTPWQHRDEYFRDHENVCVNPQVTTDTLRLHFGCGLSDPRSPSTSVAFHPGWRAAKCDRPTRMTSSGSPEPDNRVFHRRLYEWRGDLTGEAPKWVP